MRALGNSLRTAAVRAVSTSATATSRKCLLAAREWMSERAMPLAPKLAWLSVSLGPAAAEALKTKGAAMPAAAIVLRAARRVRRVLFVMGEISKGGTMIRTSAKVNASALG